MNKNNISNIKNNDKGQVLLFVVITMTLALALGVGVSLETLTNLANISDVDTSQRTFAVAEGGIERILTLPDATLDLLKSSDNGDFSDACENEVKGTPDIATHKCIIDFTSNVSDPIKTKASVSVEDFTSNIVRNGKNGYEFEIKAGDVKEVNLDGYNGDTLEICWNGSSKYSLYMSVYDDSPSVSYKKYLIECYNGGSACPSGVSWDYSNSIQAGDGSAYGYDSCYTYDEYNTQVGARIRILGTDNQPTKVAVFAFNADDLPGQGYKITSEGSLLVTNENPILKIIHVYKARSYVPGFIDFSIYSGDTL